MKPTKESVNITFSWSEPTLDVNITFLRIFPAPTCKLVLKDFNLDFERSENFQRQGMFIWGITTLHCKLPSTFCTSELDVICTLGQITFNVTSIKAERICGGLSDKLLQYIGCFIGVTIVALIAITLFLILYRCRKRTNIKSESAQCFDYQRCYKDNQSHMKTKFDKQDYEDRNGNAERKRLHKPGLNKSEEINLNEERIQLQRDTG